MNIIIVGGGLVGTELAHSLTLRGRHRVSIIDDDSDRARALAEELDVFVLHGDGTDPSMLRKAGLEDADALAAVTEVDAVNVVVSMLAKQAGVKMVVARIEGVGLQPACEEVGIDRVISSKRLAAVEIMSTIFGEEQQLDFTILAHGGLSLADLSASEVAGQRVEEIDLPEGVHLVAIIRSNQQVTLPRPQVVVEEGDSLLVLGESERALSQVRRRLRIGASSAEDDESKEADETRERAENETLAEERKRAEPSAPSE